MIRRPRSDDLIETGAVAELRSAGDALAPVARVTAAFVLPIWLLVGGGFELILGYCLWLGATIAPSMSDGIWGLLGCGLGLAAYVKFCILDIKPIKRREPPTVEAGGRP